MAAKLEFTMVKSGFDKQGLLLCTDQYVNDTVKMPYECKKCSHKGNICWNKVKSGRGCSKCGKRRTIAASTKIPILEPKYGRLTIASKPYQVASHRKMNHQMWVALVNCECGSQEKQIAVKDITSGKKASCGDCKRLMKQTLSDNMIAGWIQQYREKYSKFPSHKSGIVEFAYGDFINISWASINQALRLGQRGLSGTRSLSQFVHQTFGVINRTNQKNITEILLVEWISKYYKKYKSYPNKKIDEIVEFSDKIYGKMTWKYINSCLRFGIRGLAGGSSLAKFIVDNFENACSHLNTRQYTYDDVIQWIVHYKASHDGNIPTNASGQIEGQNFTWSSVSEWLKLGKRGFPGGSSLSKFKAETGIVEAHKNQLIENIKAIYVHLLWLPSTVWWHILIQSGIDPTDRHINLLKNIQDGKNISINDLVDVVKGGYIGKEKFTEDKVLRLAKKPDINKLLQVLENEIFAGMDEEAIEAIMVELESHIWDRLYFDEDEEIRKLESIQI